MYGKTIKKIRKDKGLKQKDICQDIVTISYYSRIERGISLPTIDVFLKIIDNLNVSIEEFIFIHHNYQKKPTNKIWFELTELYHNSDIAGLKKYKQWLSNENLKAENSIILLKMIDLFIVRLNKEKEKIDVSFITNTLINLENWTSREVIIFTSIMDMIPIETLLVLVNRLLKQRNLYTASEGFNSPYSKILLNSIMICIDNLYIHEAHFYLQTLKKMSEVRDLYGKTMCLYLEGLLFYVNGKEIEGEKKILDAFTIFKLLDMEDFSSKYRMYFENIKTKKKIAT
ncbi:helix-turn-helix domain-containing protein [Enterococcus innesii]|uniref:helix-turn-helix domain-containing protein n=1 Tax=Enterococcus innesii TaxID=2839759 RepID=UPI003984CEDF